MFCKQYSIDYDVVILNTFTVRNTLLAFLRKTFN